MHITFKTSKEELFGLESCRRCGNCCRWGSGIVLEHEIPRIAGHLGKDPEKFKEDFLEPVEFFNTSAWMFRKRILEGKEHMPFGPCIFLEGKECSIHDVKPLHCRLGTCSKEGDEVHAWFMVKYFVNPDDPESVRQYHTYIKTGGLVIPGAELESLVPDKNRLKQMLSYELLK